MKLTNLTHDAGHPLTRHKFGDLPASYLFVETVVGTGILGEAADARLTQAMQAAIGRLQNFLTPGASSDLEAMLGFFAPKGGGLPKVQEMVKKAGDLQTPVAQDQTWWQELYSIFNVQDQGVQQQIQQRAVQAAGPSMASGGPSSASNPQGGASGLDPAKAASAINGMGSGPASADPALLAQLQQQATGVQNQNAELRGMLDKNTAAREASMARMKEIQAKIDALKAKRAAGGPPAPTAESVFNFLATELLNEADVKSNLRFVASNLMKRLGYGSTTPVQEVNWLKRFAGNFDKTVDEGFRDFFRNLRMMAANPGHIEQQAQNSQLKSHNQRVAKLAIQYLSDWLTQEMNQRLQVANLKVNDVVKVGLEWKKLQAQYQKMKGGPVPEAFRQRFNAAHDQMQRIVFALDPNLAKSGTP